jgi:hypothetical protein
MELDMAGRLTHFLIAGGAIVGGMLIQGDANVVIDGIERELGQSAHDDPIDAGIDRMIDREMAKVETGGDGQITVVEAEQKRALMTAVADLVRAEGALVAVKLDEDAAADVIEAAEERRDSAKGAVERLADEVRATEAGEHGAAVRQNVRDQVREEVREQVREAVRS